MGAWGTTVFENDVSADWVPLFRENPHPGFLDETFEDIDDDPEYVNEVVSCFVLAAAEVVAAAGGQPSETEWSEYAGAPKCTGPPPFVKDWIAESGFRPDPALVKRASDCVARVQASSELKDDWEGSEYREEWEQSVQDLRDRLSKISS